MKNKVSQYISFSLGNIIEWYDFSLSIYFVTYISEAFFPNYNHFISLLLSFATFFVGFLSRPFGAVLFAWIGEKFPLKKVLHISIVAMALSTFAIACLPTYAMIGSFAPLLLLACRLLQGASAGAQFPGLLTLTVREHNDQKCFLCSISYTISTLGFLVASLVGFVLTHFYAKQLAENLWRAPYLLSIVFFVIYWLTQRKFQNETDSEKAIKMVAYWDSLKGNTLAAVATVLIVIMGGALYYFFYTYIATYYINQLHMAPSKAYLINSFTLLIAFFLYPILGKMADSVSTKKMFYSSWVLMLLLCLPFMYSLKVASLPLIIVVILLMSIGMAGAQSIVSPMLPSMFKGTWQASSCAIAYSIGVAICGAVPMVAHILEHWSSHYGFTILLLLSLLIGLVGYLLGEKAMNS